MKKIIFTLAVISLAIASCRKDNDKPNTPPGDTDEHGFITTVQTIFKETGNDNDSLVFTFSDTDGPGGLPPQVKDTIRLQSNTSYTLQIRLLDRSNPDKPEDLTSDFLKDAANHLMCMNPSETLESKLQIILTDSDGKLPIGLQSTWQAGETAQGKVKFVLKHQPGIKNGNCDLGATDVEIEFVTEIE